MNTELMEASKNDVPVVTAKKRIILETEYSHKQRLLPILEANRNKFKQLFQLPTHTKTKI